MPRAPLPSSEPQPPRPKTLRISRIPRDVSPDMLRDWLEGLAVSDKVIASGNLIQFSIAPIDDGFSQATATFKALPVPFRNVDQGPQNVDGPHKSKVVVDVHFDGMTVLYDPIQADAGPVAADVVALPGLGGHALGSWRSPEGNDVWLRDFLPKDVKNVRTIIYGYDTNLRGADWKATIYEIAKSMLDNLRNVRDKAARGRPIIFAGHSLGGLIVKQALVIVADNKDYRPYQDVLQSCYGVVFFGVPNQGIRYEELMGMVEGKRSEEFVRGLLTDKDAEMSDVLSALNRDFGRAQNCFRHGEQVGLDMLCYYEKLKTPASEAGSSHPVERLLVTQSSATYTGTPSKSYRLLPMEGDHRSMVKFRTMVDSGYMSVKGMIQEFIDEATEITYRRQQADSAHPNTCGWILRHESFRRWMDGGRTLLWIKGKPGAGKSTLMAFIYQALQKMPSRERHINLDFFFHGRGTALQKTPIGMFRSLLHQLFCKVHSVRGPIQSAFQEKKVFGEPGEDWEWQLKELQDLFFSAVAYVAETRMTTIFVDALDEAGPEAANSLVAYFHKLNDRLAGAGGVGRICISCRHYPVVTAIPGLEIVVERENYRDIATYVGCEVNSKIRIQECDKDSINARQELENAIVGQALGLFQWARLVTQMAVERYIETGSWSKARKLSELPKELTGLYEYILKKVIKDEYRPRALPLMQWVCLAESPLSVTELRLAMESDDTPGLVEEDGRMENLVSSLSGGLAEVRAGTVQFIHQSVNDFILADGLTFLTFASAGYAGQCFGQSANPSAVCVIGRGHDRLSRSCINYLQQEEVLQSVRKWNGYAPQLVKAGSHPFVLYAVKHWLLHAEKAENRGVSQGDLVQRLGNPPGEALRAWVKICRSRHILEDSNRCPSSSSTLLHVASSSGLRSTALTLLEKGVCVEERDGDGDGALHHATRQGYKDLVTLLLDAGANIEGENYIRYTPLKCAVVGGHGDVVKLLLERGANIDRYDQEFGGIIQVAVLRGSAAVARILVESGADVNARGGYFGNALQAAASGGEATIRLLLDKGAEVNIQGGYHGSALQAAAYWGHEATVRLLLDKGADINIQGGYHGSALQAAAYRGREAIVRLLLDKGADINIQGGTYRNALLAARFCDRQRIVKLLLARGARG
ncbi:MAG: hypothetical protein M1840_006956 [Geoglossum simile]|nr:MAG: hypothetical protein M1840_006956 [Geoglossum simile]